jgi:hypothetical protein
MERKHDPKSFALFLKCLSILENDVFLLYKSIAEKVDLPLPKSLLLTIASDSEKHSVLVRGVADSIVDVSVNPKDCEKKLGQPWRINKEYYEEISTKDKLNEDELVQLAEKLAVFESALGEEYYMFVQIQTLEMLTKEINQIYNINIATLGDIFSHIIKDEELHRELLITITGLLDRKVKAERDLAPIFKYQNPDSWMPPSSLKDEQNL